VPHFLKDYYEDTIRLEHDFIFEPLQMRQEDHVGPHGKRYLHERNTMRNRKKKTQFDNFQIP